MPVAGEALSLALGGASGTIRIRSTDPAQPWMLIARAIRVVSDRMAIVELARTDAVRMPERVPGRTQARGREPLVLAVHPGAGAIEGHVFPITSLGAEHCLIDATLPLERGQTLGPVEVIGERRILRCATARVIEVIPWVTAHGERRFRCRLAFEESDAPAVIDQGHDLMSDPERIERLFELASMIELSGWYDAPGWPRAHMRIGEFRDGLLTIAAAEVPPPAAIPLPAEVRIGFELFAVSYEGWVRLHRRRGSRFEVALPFVMRRRRRRREQRAVVDRQPRRDARVSQQRDRRAPRAADPRPLVRWRVHRGRAGRSPVARRLPRGGAHRVARRRRRARRPRGPQRGAQRPAEGLRAISRTAGSRRRTARR